MQLSVIICTHNPRPDYLARTLDALKAQTLPKEQWELLLIDNASKEPLAEQRDMSWHPHARHILEKELGLTPARLAGIRNANYDLILFIDDDNILDTDYLTRLLVIAKAFPWLGCLGAGVLAPEFEEEPAPELHPYCRRLALRTVESVQWSNMPGDVSTPWGAGLAVRSVVARKYVEAVSACPVRSNLGRKGAQLISGEDDEFSWVAWQMGYGKGIFPELKITHLIDRKRVQLAYFEKMEEGHAFSVALMNHIHGVEQNLPGARNPGLRRAKDMIKATLRKAIAYSLRNRSGRKALAVAYRMTAARSRGIIMAAQFIRNGCKGDIAGGKL